MKIKSIMSHPVVTVQRKNTVKEAVEKMAQKGISCVVVVEKKLPIGIFTRYDLLATIESGQDISSIAIETVMHTPVMPIEENDYLFSAARQMGMLDVRRFIIVDSSNKLTGIVTEHDIVHSYALRAFPYNVMLAPLSDTGLTATPRTPLKKIAHMMLEARKECVTILKNRKPVGVVDESLFTGLAAKGGKALKAAAETKMIKKITCAMPEDSVREAVIKMTRMGQREIVLTDENGNYTGVVTLRHLVRYIEKSQA